MAKATAKKTTAKKTTAKKTETIDAAETIRDNVQDTVKNAMESYFDTLASSSDKIAEDFSKARERNSRIMDSFLQTLENGRKDMLELSKVVATAPTDYKGNMQLAMETMNRRQECAIAFGKTLYREQSELTGEVSERAKEMFAPLKNANYDWMAPYKNLNKNLTSFWTAGAK